jgi:hypothetical protein
MIVGRGVIVAARSRLPELPARQGYMSRNAENAMTDGKTPIKSIGSP